MEDISEFVTIADICEIVPSQKGGHKSNESINIERAKTTNKKCLLSDFCERMFYHRYCYCSVWIPTCLVNKKVFLIYSHCVCKIIRAEVEGKNYEFLRFI